MASKSRGFAHTVTTPSPSIPAQTDLLSGAAGSHPSARHTRWVVGDPVGKVVGASVGECVGAFVGAFVGKDVGAFVGEAVGAFVGAFVGALVGALAGENSAKTKREKVRRRKTRHWWGSGVTNEA